MAIDYDNEKKYLQTLIEKGGGNAVWAQNKANEYAKTVPGFSLSTPQTKAPSTQSAPTYTPPSSPSYSPSGPTPSYGGSLKTESDGSQWYVSNGQQYRVNAGDLPTGVGGTLSTDQQGGQFFNWEGQGHMVGNPMAYAQAYGAMNTPYTSKIDALLQKFNSVPAFNPNSVYDSPEYLAMKQLIESNASKTGSEVMGQAAAMTGGLPSSYAIAAAKESTSDVKNRLNEQIPSLTQNAYNRYLQEQGLTLDQINTLAGLENSSYQRFSNDRNYDQSVLESLRNYDRGVLESDRNYEQNQKEFDYKVGRDKVMDQKWLDQFDYTKKQDALNYNLQTKQISISERNANLARDKYNWEKDPTNPANMANPETIGGLYATMFANNDPQAWLRDNAQWLSDAELKALAGYLPNNDAAAILSQLLK